MNEDKDFLLSVFGKFLNRPDLFSVTVKNDYGEITVERSAPQENETNTYAVGFTLGEETEENEE